MSDSDDSQPKPKKGTKRKAGSSQDKKKRGQGKKARKQQGEPKKPLSAYMFYVKENRAKLVKDNPNLSFGEVGKRLGEMWASLTPDEKAQYVELNRKDKDRYADAKKEWDAKGHGSSDKESKKKRAPKKVAKKKKEESEDEEDRGGDNSDDGGNDDNDGDDGDDGDSSD